MSVNCNCPECIQNHKDAIYQDKVPHCTSKKHCQDSCLCKIIHHPEYKSTTPNNHCYFNPCIIQNRFSFLYCCQICSKQPSTVFNDLTIICFISGTDFKISYHLLEFRMALPLSPVISASMQHCSTADFTGSVKNGCILEKIAINSSSILL